jgi:hypothetical protein
VKATIVHVWQQRIRGNMRKPAAEREPPIIIRRGKTREYANTADLVMDGKLVARVHYSPDAPLDCGARLWIAAEPGCTVHPTS